MTWKVETIDANEHSSTAAQIMLDNKCGCLPVVEEGVLAGILTEADFVKSMAHVEASGRRQRLRGSATRGWTAHGSMRSSFS